MLITLQQKYPLKMGSNKVGRRKQKGLLYLDDGNKEISGERIDLRMTRGPEGLRLSIVDLGSMNGTYVRSPEGVEKKLEPGVEVEINATHIVRLGRSVKCKVKLGRVIHNSELDIKSTIRHGPATSPRKAGNHHGSSSGE
mmetsp:Transcript_28963/g.54225  ORF Transcript_28963/g.54225 Transcript_28963/m.54225 type:complete len:140 (-) Transcript_28963:315-734(-)